MLTNYSPKQKPASRAERLAQQLYLKSGYTYLQIANELNVKEATVKKWAKLGKWELLKQTEELSPNQLIAKYLQQSQLITQLAEEEERPLTIKECDALAKLATAIEKLEKSISPMVVMSVLERFNNYLVESNPELTQQLLHYEKEYLYQLIEQY